MTFRWLFICVFFALSVSAENCPLGTRMVAIRNCTIDNAVLVSHADSLARMAKILDFYHRVVAKVKAGTTCITFVGIEDSLLQDTSYASMFTQSAARYTGEAIPGDCDYLFSGTFAMQGGEMVFTPEVVGAGDEIELAPLKPINLIDGFDPENSSITASTAIGSLYTYVTTAERTKREQGAPYAINPSVVLTPTKRILDFNESATIHIAITDCDGAVLPSYAVSFSVSEGGILVPASTLTDGNGTSDVAFTAGNTPAIAYITTRFSYKTPSGKIQNCAVTPLAIQIRKPQNCWYIHAEYDYIKNSSESFSEVCGPNVGTGLETSRGYSKLFVAAWVQNIGTQGRFVANPVPIKIAVTGYNDENVSGTSSGKGSHMFVVETHNVVQRETAKNSGAPTYTFQIGPTIADFSIRDVASVINGFDFTARNGYDKLKEPPAISESNSQNLAADATMSASAQGFAKDTSYQIVNNYDIFDMHFAEISTVTQKFQFDGKIGIFDKTYSFSQNRNGKIGTTCSRTESGNLTQTYTAKITMEYNDNSAVHNPGQVGNTMGWAGNLVSRNGMVGVTFARGFVGKVIVDIFDSKGRLVMSKSISSPASGSTYWMYNTHPLSGLYIARIQSAAAGNESANYVSTAIIVVK